MYQSSSLPHHGLSAALLLLGFIWSTAYAQTTVAIVGDEPVTQQQVDDSIGNQIYALERQLFALRNTALDNLISRKLLEREAARQKLSIEDLKNRWMGGEIKVEAAQIEDLFQKNQAAFGLMNPDEVREKLRLDLEAQVRLKRFREALSALRQKTLVNVLLAEPRVGPLHPSYAFAAKGRTNATVVITEFSDFQCPYCRAVQATLNQVLKEHPDDVRLEFKHLPLEDHPFAFAAARSAFCAGKQGAFWKFHDALFDSTALSQQRIETIPRELGLDVQDFQACMSSPDSQTAINADLQEARRLGLEGTPSFIINGRPLLGSATVEAFNDAIARELNPSPLRISTSQNEGTRP
ncbi:MAG TPA: thioredoxin domain-containing protein [Pyrinomonadaceae bacterium]